MAPSSDLPSGLGSRFAARRRPGVRVAAIQPRPAGIQLLIGIDAHHEPPASAPSPAPDRLHIAISITVTNPSGQNRTVEIACNPGEHPRLTRIEDRSYLTVLVPWDGRDGTGDPMTGGTWIEYQVTVSQNSAEDGSAISNAKVASGARLVRID